MIRKQPTETDSCGTRARRRGGSLRKFLYLVGEQRQLAEELFAESRVHDAEVLDDELSPSRVPFEFIYCCGGAQACPGLRARGRTRQVPRRNALCRH